RLRSQCGYRVVPARCRRRRCPAQACGRRDVPGEEARQEHVSTLLDGLQSHGALTLRPAKLAGLAHPTNVGGASRAGTAPGASNPAMELGLKHLCKCTGSVNERMCFDRSPSGILGEYLVTLARCRVSSDNQRLAIGQPSPGSLRARSAVDTSDGYLVMSELNRATLEML